MKLKTNTTLTEILDMVDATLAEAKRFKWSSDTLNDELHKRIITPLGRRSPKNFPYHKQMTQGYVRGYIAAKLEDL